ncbi:hypothetical protein WSM22_02310 [Cytophagales bacterium WSM2-2]|nr:hypothetical protein WSM22_02310 [Cytophagales bacterium WSM2-2]
MSIHLQAQFPEKLKDGYKMYLSPDSSKFLKLSMLGQFWVRSTQNNPGTTIENVPQSETIDMSIRRFRVVFSGVLTDRVNFFIQFGQNNLNYLSARKSGSFFHDIAADYAVIKKHLSIGAGLNGWNGPSRFSNSQLLNILVLDPPGYQEVTNDTYDQFVRRLGVYAKGKIGKLDYRVSVGKPFVIQTTSGSGIEPISTNTSFSTLPPHFVNQGYFMYQFLDQESNFAPSIAGTYIGKKKIFNIGGGFYYQKNAMFRHSDAVTKDTVSQDIKLLAVDIFYDTPLNKTLGTAFSFYACFSNYDYGTNFIKVTGPNNPATGSANTTTSFDKANYGNAFPYLGTGKIGYIQTAYKFRDKLFGDQGTLQPFFDLQYSNYDRLKVPMCVFDIGVNWLIAGNNSKITFNYQNRPFFSANGAGDLIEQSRWGEFVVQYQAAF